MSLQNMLTSSIRQRIPDSVFAQCLPNDREVVENILTVVQQCFPVVSVAGASVERQAKVYIITIPLPQCKIHLHHLRAIESYSPARVADVRVSIVSNGSACMLELIVNDETAPISTSEVDIVRVRKRALI